MLGHGRISKSAAVWFRVSNKGRGLWNLFARYFMLVL